MASSRLFTRQRLIRSAIQLFTAQGITETTNRKIADLAGVNEVTLFRQFGSKYGLLLAVMEDSGIFTWLGGVLGQQANQVTTFPDALRNYADMGLQALEQIPELVRSLIGEAGHYPPEHRQALGRALTQANQYTAQYLTTVLHRQHLQLSTPPETAASLLNSLMLGYIVLKLTSDAHGLWSDRANFVDELVNLFLNALGAVAETVQTLPGSTIVYPPVTTEVADLPATLVHTILKYARKVDLQDYAIAYVLFGAGLEAIELVGMERSHSWTDHHLHLLQVPQGRIRQVPLNQWILGRRYGNHPTNPLMQWLKSRKDAQAALFLNDAGNPISEMEIRLRWQLWVNDLLTPQGYPPAIAQTQDTWCVEMLMKGVSQDDLSILTGRSTTELQPYMRRAREKIALEQAMRLDQKMPPVILPPTESQPLA